MSRADAKAIVDNAPAFDAATTWPEPQELIVRDTAMQPYPVEALPDGIKQAVQEVQNFVRCPVAMVANVALAALSIVGQSLVDVRRASSLTSPVGLYFLAVAVSGERKSSCDGYFMQSIQHWQKGQEEKFKPVVKQYEADMRIWIAKTKGVQAAIEKAAREGKPCEAKEQELTRLEKQKPEEPRIPRLIYGDTTPEALAFALAKKWPCGGVMSSEAGIVFGGVGMSQDSVVRNLALLNTLWDGVPLSIDRKTTESFTVRGARLTMGLAVQPETIRRFFHDTKGLARGTGFAARFLIAWPESTQGERLFKEPPAHWPHLSAFHRRIETLLDHPMPINSLGQLAPTMLDLSPEAKAAWVRFHDDVEAELKPNGDMAETRDVASKAADNVARMAGLFHVFANGTQGQISFQHVQAAAAIVGWHLYEARRFLGEIALPQKTSHAAVLDAWLQRRFVDTKASHTSFREVQRFAPNPLRNRSALEAALGELEEAGRFRLCQHGQSKIIEINPALRGA